MLRKLRVFSKLLIYFRRDAIILTERNRRCREHEDFADMRLCRKIQGQFYRVSRILQKKQPRRRRFYALCVSRKNDRAPQSVVLRLEKRSSRSDIQKLRQRKNQGFQKNHKRNRHRHRSHTLHRHEDRYVRQYRMSRASREKIQALQKQLRQLRHNKEIFRAALLPQLERRHLR